MERDLHFTTILQQEFEKIRAKNPRYSLRSFAKKLDLSAATLSTVLNRKGGVSMKRAKRIVNRLRLAPAETEYFLTLVQMNCSKSVNLREMAKIKLRKFNVKKNEVSLDHFKVIADWYHFAIVELTHLQTFQSTPEWIARSLGISAQEASGGVDRLLRVGLLEKTSDGVRASKDFYFVPNGTPAEFGREFHRQLLKKASEAITSDPIEKRVTGASILRTNQKDLPELRKRIHDFRRELGAWLEKTETPDSVYALCIQAFRLDQDF